MVIVGQLVKVVELGHLYKGAIFLSSQDLTCFSKSDVIW